MTISELIRVFLAWSSVHRKPRTTQYYREQLEPWARAIGDKPLSQIGPLDLLLWGKSFARVQSVQRLFSWAKTAAGLVDINPFEKIERPKPGRRVRILTRRESVLFRRRARADFRAVLLACQESGARPQEVRALRWGQLAVEDPAARYWPQVLEGHGFFILADYKSRDRRKDGGPSRIVPVSPRLGRLLWRIYPSSAGNSIVFKNNQGRPFSKDATVWRMRRLRAKIINPDQGDENICLYSLRHTTATSWAAAGVPAAALSSLLGHRNISTTQKYLHLERYKGLGAIREVWKGKRPKGTRKNPRAGG